MNLKHDPADYLTPRQLAAIAKRCKCPVRQAFYLAAARVARQRPVIDAITAKGHPRDFAQHIADEQYP